MSNSARLEELDDFKSRLCDMQMRCRGCICKDCPRDCKECEERGIEARSPQCLCEGDNYRKEGGA